MEIPESLSPTVRRYFFSTKEEAQLFARRQTSALRLYGKQGGGILPPLVQEQASRALEAIKPFGIPLVHVVTDWIEKHQLAKKSIRFEEAIDLFIANRQRSPSYHASLRQTRNSLKCLHDKLMCDISQDDLSEAIEGMSDALRNFRTEA